MKHAFLIIAHNNPEILYAQLEILDSVDVDFYFHLDAKMEINKSDLESHALKSNIYYIEPKKIRWGHYSLTECEIRLLKAAVMCKTEYDYYHMLSGVDMPIKTLDTIDAFFTANKGKEFIHFASKSVDESTKERISLYHICPGRFHWQRKINGLAVKIQRIIGINRLNKLKWEVKKGSNWFSITDRFAKYLIEHENLIAKQFKYCFAGDEIFLQTILFNSKMKFELYMDTFNDDYHACMRLIDWKRGNPYVFGIDDFEELMECDYMFARKFDYNSKPEIVDKLKAQLK